MGKSEASQERLRRTKDRMCFRTAQGVEEMIANDTGADVAAGNDEVMVVAEEAAVQPDTEVEMVQLEVEADVRLQKWRSPAHRQDIQHFRARPGHEENRTK